MPQRQVMVVEKDSGRCKQLCALLSNHDLIANPARSVERVLETQEWPGVILIGDKNPGASGWELAKRIRAIDSRVPIILLGNGSADSSHLRPMIQSYLPHDAPAELIVNEVERWLKTVPAARQSPRRPGRTATSGPRLPDCMREGFA